MVISMVTDPNFLEHRRGALQLLAAIHPAPPDLRLTWVIRADRQPEVEEQQREHDLADGAPSSPRSAYPPLPRGIQNKSIARRPLWGLRTAAATTWALD
jgi:hypothetical protein